MNMTDLTKTINKKLSALQSDVNALPNGGGLEILRADLMTIVDKISLFADEIDHINGLKLPENVHKKPGKTTIDNGFSINRGGRRGECPEE